MVRKKDNYRRCEMHRKGNAATVMAGCAVIGVVILVAFACFWAYERGFFGGEPLNAGGGLGRQSTSSLGGSCPDTKTTAVTSTLYNSLNTTGSESFDAAYRVYDEEGNFITSGTDTTSGAIQIGSTNLPCDETFVLRLLSADGDGGDNAQIRGIRSCNGECEVIEGGRALKFTTEGSSMSIELNGAQHGILEFKAFDVKQNAWACNSDDVCSDYELDGVTFESTTNASAITLAAGEDIEHKLYVRSTQDDTDFNDAGTLLLVDAATTVYKVPSVKLGSETLSDTKGTLDVNEARAWAGYEYVYTKDAPVTRAGVEYTIALDSLDGVNPGSGDDPQYDFASRGAALQTAGSKVIYSGVSDASSPTAIFTVQDVTINVA